MGPNNVKAEDRKKLGFAVWDKRDPFLPPQAAELNPT